MSKPDDKSMQSLQVDDIEQNAAQHQTDGEIAADGVLGEHCSDIPSDLASTEQNSVAGGADACPQMPNSAAGAVGKTAKVFGMSKPVLIGLVAAAAVTFGVVAGIVVATQQPAIQDWYDSAALQGQFEGKSPEEIQAALNEEVAKGMMNISIAASIVFPDGSSEGEARIENIAANPMDQKVSIALKDTGEVVYESGAIAPGSHIQTIALSRDLDPGKYEAVATFTGYDRETHKQTGQVAAEIELIIEG